MSDRLVGMRVFWNTFEGVRSGVVAYASGDDLTVSVDGRPGRTVQIKAYDVIDVQPADAPRQPAVPAIPAPYVSSANCERPHTDVVPLRARLIGLYGLGYDATDETLYDTAERSWRYINNDARVASSTCAQLRVRNAELTRRANELGDECGDLANELARSQDEVRDLLVENARLRRSLKQ
jgi:hypothetical protein